MNTVLWIYLACTSEIKHSKFGAFSLLIFYFLVKLVLHYDQLHENALAMLHFNYYKNKSSRKLSVELSCFLAAEWLKVGDFWFLKRKLLIFYQRLRRFAGLSSHLDLRRVDKNILFMEAEVVSHFFGTDDFHLHLVLGNVFGVRLENHIVHYFFFNAIHY